MSDSVLVQAAGLTKVYPARGDVPEFRAVDGIGFELRRGETFGFLGPNGAGKSTTMRMIGATSPRSGGLLSVLGMDPDIHGPAIRARLGVVPQDDALDRELTVRENLYIYGRYFGLKRAVIRQRSEELLDFAQLREKSGNPVEALSGGMRRRLTIARSLINNPGYGLAGRAHHRAGPAGQARAIGPALPAQAGRDHAAADHPLHG